MIRSGWIASAAAIVLSARLPVVWADSDPNTKIADLFEVRFDSAEYTHSTRTTHSSEGRREQMIERLRLESQIDVADANLVLGISGHGIITQVETATGEVVGNVAQSPPDPTYPKWYYMSLRYGMRVTRPPKPAKWKT